MLLFAVGKLKAFLELILSRLFYKNDSEKLILVLVRPVFNPAVPVHAMHRADGGDRIDLGVNSNGYRCGPHPGRAAPRTLHPPFPPRHPRIGDFSSLRSGSGCATCPQRDKRPRVFTSLRPRCKASPSLETAWPRLKLFISR